MHFFLKINSRVAMIIQDSRVPSVSFKNVFDSFTCRSRKHGCFFTSSMMMNQQVDFAQPFNGICNTTAYLVQFILKEKSAFLDDETFHTT